MSSHNSRQSVHIGVVGGGQLGAMLASAVLKAGHQITVLDPTLNCPAATVGAMQIEAGFFDSQNIRALVEQVDVTTVELENVDTETLNALAQQGAPVIPQPSVVALLPTSLSKSSVTRITACQPAASNLCPTQVLTVSASVYRQYKKQSAAGTTVGCRLD